MGIGPQNLGASGGKKGHTPCGHKKPEMVEVEIEVSPFNKMVDVDGTEVDTSKPGMSNAGKYKGVHEFAGPHGTYPINTKERAESAIKLAHNAADPEQIKENVYKKWPSLEPEVGVQSPDNKSKNA